MTPRQPYDESDDAQQTLGLDCTRCRDCKHWFALECLHERDFEEVLGEGSVQILEQMFGLCDWDAPAIVRGDNREYDREGYDCWEAR